MFNDILVVCVGNICRSPTGEYLLKSLLPNKNISSAGISALVGKGADKLAIDVANANGVDLSKHKAQQLTKELCKKFDLILVMEPGHLSAVTEISPESRGKVILLSKWEDFATIPDPYRQSKEAFEHAYSLIYSSCVSWVEKLG
ncbi:hypothetical protein TW85_10990 [Marinomonas sp. S3726]|uniref:low molecular weight protein-tyrosine-phosphatase n=1 Tax=Marinomonas sp. S3726 TaxID=579484 RepID=UPI0005F9C60D|nr:low molecular weight protein-tyrosine-phosphatase [Marinomonas sp. S3726]KJZ13727.1 hypothetical protein TW85_10990 [Marinomonas sp. S3726]